MGGIPLHRRHRHIVRPNSFLRIYALRLRADVSLMQANLYSAMVDSCPLHNRTSSSSRCLMDNNCNGMPIDDMFKGHRSDSLAVVIPHLSLLIDGKEIGAAAWPKAEFLAPNPTKTASDGRCFGMISAEQRSLSTKSQKAILAIFPL